MMQRSPPECVCSRQVGHLAKGFGTSTFTKQDIAKLKQVGNEVRFLMFVAWRKRLCGSLCS